MEYNAPGNLFFLLSPYDIAFILPQPITKVMFGYCILVLK